MSSRDDYANLQRIFSQNKADDDGKPWWLGEESNAVMRKYGIFTNIERKCHITA
jgi:hypothetical protein